MKNIFVSAFFLLLLGLSSCALLEFMMTLDTINKTNETIVVHDKDYFYGVELARISTGKVQRINIRKGKTIYIGGGKTKKRYIDIICDTDNETYSIH